MNRVAPEVITGLDTPCFILDEAALEANLATLREVRRRTGCKILLALKAFALPAVFPRMAASLDGVAASSLHEARLGREEFGGEVHVYSPAFIPGEFGQVLGYADHVTFNSFSQLRRFGPAGRARGISLGLRINPEHHEEAAGLYCPCAPYSRLGVTADEFARHEAEAGALSGLHFHVLCAAQADALARAVEAVERGFAAALRRVSWVNFGGGHLIAAGGYDVDLLCAVVSRFQERHGVRVLLEPGEGIVAGTGWLAATVLDVVTNGRRIAILDASAANHVPSVIENPAYRPRVLGAAGPGVHPHDYRLGGVSCLSGDLFGDYSFPRPLAAGDRLLFEDMAHYTLVRTTTFNGVRRPSVAVLGTDGSCRLAASFGYEDFRGRLGQPERADIVALR